MIMNWIVDQKGTLLCLETGATLAVVKSPVSRSYCKYQLEYFNPVGKDDDYVYHWVAENNDFQPLQDKIDLLATQLGAKVDFRK